MSCQEGACEQILPYIYDWPPEDVVVFFGKTWWSRWACHQALRIDSLIQARWDLLKNLVWLLDFLLCCIKKKRIILSSHVISIVTSFLSYQNSHLSFPHKTCPDLKKAHIFSPLFTATRKNKTKQHCWTDDLLTFHMFWRGQKQESGTNSWLGVLSLTWTGALCDITADSSVDSLYCVY